MVQTLCKLYLLYLNTHPLMTPTLSSPGIHPLGFPGVTVVKNLPAKAGRHRRHAFHLWVKSGRFPWRSKWQLTPVFLPGKSHGERSPAGYSPRGHKESDTTEGLSSHAYIYKSVCVFIKTHAQGCLYQVYLLHPRIKTLPNTHQPRMDT